MAKAYTITNTEDDLAARLVVGFVEDGIDVADRLQKPLVSERLLSNMYGWYDPLKDTEHMVVVTNITNLITQSEVFGSYSPRKLYRIVVLGSAGDSMKIVDRSLLDLGEDIRFKRAVLPKLEKDRQIEVEILVETALDMLVKNYREDSKTLGAKGVM